MTDEQLARNVFHCFDNFRSAVEQARKEGMVVEFGSPPIGRRDPTSKRPIVSRHYHMDKEQKHD